MPQSQQTDDRIKELAAKKAQLDAQIAALDARRRLSQKRTKTALNGFWALWSLTV